MAEVGRPRRDDIERPKCPWPGHKQRDVQHHGVIKTKAGAVARRRYLCSPGTTKEHTFSLPVGPDGKLLPPEPTVGTGLRVRKLDTRRPYVPPEPCTEHPDSTVTRSGVYKTGTGSRQRYLCTPVGWKPGTTRAKDKAIARHVFTPVLPRAHVEGDAACPHCAELRAINRGDTAVARWHTATTGHVATALERLGKGESYADVAEWLQSELRPKGPSAKKKDGYRRAADVVEVFAPVVWNDWLSTLDGQDPAPVGRRRLPRVVMVDDLPIFDKAQKRRRQQQRFAILGLAEVVLSPTSGKVRDTRLRLLRAYPSHSTDAYTLLFADLPYVPDFVIADGGKGIEPAVKLLAERTGHEVTFITSAYHVREQLRRVIAKARASKSSFTPGDLAARVERFGPTQSRQDWVQWWADYERRLKAQGVPRSGWPLRAKSESYQRTIEQLDALAPWPDIPRSTGHLEDLFARYVKASIKPRGRGFGNLIRTNQLLDLFVVRANGYFDDRARVVAALRRDAVEGDPENAGFAPPVRTITDPGLDRSLLDESVVARLVTQRGLDAPPAKPVRKRAGKKTSQGRRTAVRIGGA